MKKKLFAIVTLSFPVIVIWLSLLTIILYTNISILSSDF